MTTRDAAALICQLVASNGLPFWRASQAIGLPQDSSAAGLAMDAYWRAKGWRSDAERAAESECMLRTGWRP